MKFSLKSLKVTCSLYYEILWYIQECKCSIKLYFIVVVLITLAEFHVFTLFWDFNSFCFNQEATLNVWALWEQLRKYCFFMTTNGSWKEEKYKQLSHLLPVATYLLFSTRTWATNITMPFLKLMWRKLENVKRSRVILFICVRT